MTVLRCSEPRMGTYTDPDLLYKPAAGETGWDALLNGSIQKLQDVLNAHFGTARVSGLPSATDPHDLKQINVMEKGAVGDGVADDTAAFQAAESEAGSFGTILAPGNRTFLLNDYTPGSGVILRGTGWGTVLKRKSGAAAAVILSAVAGAKAVDLVFDGNGNGGAGVRYTGAATASSIVLFDHVKFLNCLVGCDVLAGSPVNEADQALFRNCHFSGCTTGYKNASPNGQNHAFQNCRWGTTTTCLSIAGSASITLVGCQLNGYTTGIIFPTAGPVSGFWVDARDTLFEGAAGPSVDIDGNTGWPSRGVNLDGCGLHGSTATIRNAINDTRLRAAWTSFLNGPLTLSGNGIRFIEEFCAYTSGATYNPTGTSVRRLRRDNAGEAYFLGANQKQFIDAVYETIMTGKGATASRPSASSAGQGAQWFDTTLGKPIWSDGTNWRDAAGSVV